MTTIIAPTPGTAGWHDAVSSESHDGDDPDGVVLAYAVAMDWAISA
jgi:hypothetical protein